MRFIIDKIDGTTNCEFFAEFSGFEFEAKTKKDAYRYIEDLQRRTDSAIEEAGGELTGYDPCLFNCVSVMTGQDEDGDPVWEPVEWRSEDVD